MNQEATGSLDGGANADATDAAEQSENASRVEEEHRLELIVGNA